MWRSHWSRWWLVACSVLSHYLNQLKDRQFKTSRRPCCVTVITMLHNAISVLQMITSPMRESGGLLCYKPGHAIEQTVEDWWLETSWRSCGVTVITTQFRCCKWLRPQWGSEEVSLVQVMACRLFGAKPLPEPVEGPVIWNAMTAMLLPCNNYAVITVITTRVVFHIQIAKCAYRRARTMGHAGS